MVLQNFTTPFMEIKLKKIKTWENGRTFLAISFEKQRTKGRLMYGVNLTQKRVSRGRAEFENFFAMNMSYF